MTYHYTDQQLNVLNQGDYVYSVNPDYANRVDNQTDTVVSVPDHMLQPNETNTLTVGDQQFQVIATESDPETGFDGMAVAPIVNGKPDYSSVAVIVAERQQGKNRHLSKKIQICF